MKYKLKDLEKDKLKRIVIDTKLYPARPNTYKTESFWSKVKQAWGVLSGKLDTLKWPCGQ